MRRWNLLSVWWFKAVPEHPYQAKPGELCLIETRRRSGATAGRAGLPANPPRQWNLGSLQAKSISGKQLTRNSDRLHPAFFFHCTGHAEQLLLYSYAIAQYLGVNTKLKNFFSAFHTLSSKKFKVLLKQYPKPPSVVSFIAQGWELWPAGKVFALKRGYSKIQRKTIFYHCLPLCFD